jgi:phosphate transport system protein
VKLHQTRLQADKAEIQTEIGKLAEGVRQAVDEAVLGLLNRDSARMYQVILDDHPFNRSSRAIDRACHAFVARHIPAAGHLRWVSSILRLNIGLERIGDYAVTICRVGVRLRSDLPQPIQDHIRSLADQSIRMLELATRAFLKGDADLARDTIKMAKKIDVTHDKVFQALVDHADGLPLIDVISLQTIYDKLERVSDQAKNLCEEAVFVTTGETKQPIDANDAFLAPLAESLARRSHPGSGDYTSEGIEAASAYDAALTTLADELELDLGGPHPAPFTALQPFPSEYHVIVSLNLAGHEVPEIPFQSIHLDWQVELPAEGEPKAELVRELQHRISELMEKLRGKDAP